VSPSSVVLICFRHITQGTRPEIGSQAIRKLLNALDEYVTQPARDLDKPFFLPIENVYSIQGGYFVTCCAHSCLFAYIYLVLFSDA